MFRSELCDQIAKYAYGSSMNQGGYTCQSQNVKLFNDQTTNRSRIFVTSAKALTGYSVFGFQKKKRLRNAIYSESILLAPSSNYK